MVRRALVILTCAIAALVCALPPRAQTAHGAGATFPYPLYASWAYAYGSKSRRTFNYQSIGSGGGIRQVFAGTVDFGASEAPLSPEKLEEAGLIQFPMVIGGVTPVVHLAGVEPDRLKLTGPLLADIFLGKITRWDDPAISGLNPSIRLPAMDISVVNRADGSGTTWLFTGYLSLVSAQWRERVGRGTSVKWPVGMSGKGNEGVAAYLLATKGSIGYLEYTYAGKAGLATVRLKNREGRFVRPGLKSFRAALDRSRWAEGEAPSLLDRAGERSWPMTGFSYILLKRKQTDPEKGKALLAFFHWCLTEGRAKASAMHYLPLPPKLVERVEERWATALRSKGQPLWPIPGEGKEGSRERPAKGKSNGR